MPNENEKSAPVTWLNYLAIGILSAALLCSFYYIFDARMRLQDSVETIIRLEGKVDGLKIEVSYLKEYNQDVKKSLDKLSISVDTLTKEITRLAATHESKK